MRIFSHVHLETEDNENVVAVVNRPIVELLASDPEAFMRFLTRQNITPQIVSDQDDNTSPVEMTLPAPIPPNEMIRKTHERLQHYLSTLDEV